MSCVFARCFKISIGLLLGCAIFVGYSAVNALGVVQRNNRIPTTANFLNKGDRLSIVSASKPRANILSPGTMRSSAKRPPWAVTRCSARLPTQLMRVSTDGAKLDRQRAYSHSCR